jgi:hypothetical protein
LERLVRRTRLSGDERRASGGTAVVGVIIRKHHAFLGNPVDIWRVMPNEVVCIGADVGLAEIVTNDYEDVRLCRLLGLRGLDSGPLGKGDACGYGRPGY